MSSHALAALMREAEVKVRDRHQAACLAGDLELIAEWATVFALIGSTRAALRVGDLAGAKELAAQASELGWLAQVGH